MDDCKGILGDIFGHNFKPIFNIKTEHKGTPELIEAVNKLTTNCMVGSIEDVLGELSTQTETYIQHVCTRCGAVVKNN